jgi:carboxypeptidase Taq
METKMPPRAIDLRSQQLSQLSRIEHKLATDRQIGVLLYRIEKNPEFQSLDLHHKRNTDLIRKNYDEQTKLPEKLVSETERQRTVTINVWKKAKASRDFELFKPQLEKLFNLRMQAAEILMDVKGTSTPYDALIDIYEHKMTSDAIAKVFDELKQKLVILINKCQSAPRQPDLSILKSKVPVDIQRGISDSLAEYIGYDVVSMNAGGRIDETEHPFTTGYFDDVRITTHYYEDNVFSSIFSVLHEGGHALYEQYLQKDWMYQPIGTAPSMGFHESQSRFVENMVGRSREFWEYYLPKLKAMTGETFSGAGLDDFVRAVNSVKPSKIRIEADEVTYSLHIIIRFEIERELFLGKLDISELPELWNEKYKSYLDLKIENDSEGVMQDTHWAGGDFGYFPSYALGNIYGGQILSKMADDIPDWRTQIGRGNYQNIREWLIRNIYDRGNLFDPPGLLKQVTGKQIRVDDFIDYLNNKYSQIYGF